MAVEYAYTLEEAQKNLEVWKACDYALASGQAKSYKIGTREFTSVDGPYIAERIRFFSNIIKGYTNNARRNRAFRCVPRDL